MAWHGGEEWIPAEEAAVRLNVPVGALHKRIASKGVGKVDGKFLGGKPHVREADVARMETEGLPHPLWEAIEDGAVVQVPDRWLILERPNSPHGPSAFVATRPMTIGPHPARHIEAGDLLAEGEDSGLDKAVSRHDVCELPAERGVLGLVRVLQQRQTILEVGLATFLAHHEEQTGKSDVTDALIGRGIVTEAQAEDARRLRKDRQARLRAMTDGQLLAEAKRRGLTPKASWAKRRGLTPKAS